jgi:hypothetical protein
LQARYESAHCSDDADSDEGDPVSAAAEGSEELVAAEGGEDQGGRSTVSSAGVDAGGEIVPTHYFVDVPHPEESTYDATEQHVQIDPALRAQ